MGVAEGGVTGWLRRRASRAQKVHDAADNGIAALPAAQGGVNTHGPALISSLEPDNRAHLLGESTGLAPDQKVERRI